MQKRKIMITVAQTGAFQGKEANPAIPITPDEIASSAYDCVNAGASIIHIHARDKNGLSSNDSKIYSEIGSKIKARCNPILQYSTAPSIQEGATAEDGMKLLDDKDLFVPEMCSLDCSLIGTSWKGRTIIHHWTREFLIKYIQKMRKLRIKPEFECFNIETLEDIFGIYGPKKLLDEPISLSFVMGMERISQGAISFSEENLDFMIKKLPKDKQVNFTTIAIGSKNHLHGLALSILKGGHIRVGLEDNIYSAPGRLLKSNAEIVEKAVRVVHEMGHEVATPEEARMMLRLPQS